VGRRLLVVALGLMMLLGANLAAVGTPGGPGEDTRSPPGPSLSFAGGDGSVDDPYQISTVDELQNMSANLSAHYELIGDIDASSTSTWNAERGFIPVGDQWVSFTGSFDGNGHTISGLTVNHSASDLGLFGHIEGASVHDLSMTDVFINGSSDNGAICGVSISGTIYNCTVEGEIKGMDRTGGVAGWASGTITDCHVSGVVSGYTVTGGLVGRSEANITRCSNNGSVTALFMYAGGLVGDLWSGTVSDSWTDTAFEVEWPSASFIGGFAGINRAGTLFSCHSKGTIDATSGVLGGFVGASYGTIIDCYSTSSINITKYAPTTYGSTSNIGGFAGNLEGSVQYCYSTGPVTISLEETSSLVFRRVKLVGGFAGNNEATLTHSFSTGSVQIDVTRPQDIWIERVGGFIGSNEGEIADCYSTSSVACTAKGADSWVDHVGGMLGNSSSGSVSKCYSTGQVDCSAVGQNAYTDNIGGFFGSLEATTVVGCFWDTTTSGSFNATGSGPHQGMAGRTTSDMMRRETFSDARWSFKDTWLMAEGKSYPHLTYFYQRPSVNLQGPGSVMEDVPVLFTYQVSVGDYPTVNRVGSVDLTSDASSWLTWDGAQRTITGTPTDAEVGLHWLNVSVVDIIGVSSWMNVTLRVVNVNDPPVITTHDMVAASEDELYIVQYGATDVDPTNDPMSWTMSTDAGWLSMDGDILMGTPRNDDVGEWSVNVTVSDGNGGSASTEFTLTVENTNDPPRIITVPGTSATEDEEHVQTFEAEDVDAGHVISWALEGPDWLTIDGETGILSGTPTNDDVGAYWVKVTATDGHEEASVEFMLVVENANDVPVWVETPDDQELMEGDLMFLDVLATDEDGDDLTFELDSSPDSGIVINRASGAIRWLEAVPGTFEVELSAFDGTERIYHWFNVTVEAEPEPPEPPANKVPIIAAVGKLNVTAGEAFHLQLVGTDGDPWDMNNLTWTIVNGPEDMLISSGGEVLWLPDGNTVGTRYVTVELTDGKDKTEISFEVEVLKAEVDDGDGDGVDDSGDYLWMAVALAVVVLLLVVILLWQYTGQREPPLADGAGEVDEPEDEGPEDDG